MSRFKPKPHYQQFIETYGPRALINNNDEFLEWILYSVSLHDAVTRCPNITSELFEEYTNDWIEHVELEAEKMGLYLDEDFNVVEDEEEDEERS